MSLAQLVDQRLAGGLQDSPRTAAGGEGVTERRPASAAGARARRGREKN
jgi:hypothetical protein